MSTPFTEFKAQKIHLSTGESVSPEECFIESDSGNVFAFKTEKGYLLADDITLKEDRFEYSGLILKSASKGENWKKFSVRNRKGSRRGRVTELWIDPINFMITQIECTRTLFRYFPKKRIYSAEDIFEVLPGKKLIIIEEENRVFQGKEALSLCQ